MGSITEDLVVERCQQAQATEVTEPLKFFIFGNNISHSLSPTIHNTAFAHYGLPHHYAIYQTADIDDNIRAIIKDPSFGGASVTYPHKLAILPLLDSVTETASQMGAVNTVLNQSTTQGGRLLRGDNTDWIGIRNCILRHYPSSSAPRAPLIIGAGGAARAAVFALHKLGQKRVTIVNRTLSKSQRLAASFPDLNFTFSDSLAQATPADLIITCIPADDITEDDIPTQIFGQADGGGGGVVIEMSYRPPVSALMTAASRQDNWIVLGGVDVLKEQAYAQFNLWTGLSAPVDVIERALKDR